MAEPWLREPATTSCLGPASTIRKLARWGFVVAVVLFWVAVIAHNWSELSSFQWNLHAGWAAVSFVSFSLYFLALGGGWVFVAISIDRRMGALNGLSVWLLSMPARYMPGNLWHIATRARLAARHHISPECVLISSAVEQALTVISAACLGLLWLPTLFGQGSIASVIAFLLVSFALMQPPVIRLLLRAASKLLNRKVPEPYLGYRQVALLFGWYVFTNAVNGTAFFLLAVAFGGVSWSQWPLMVSAYSLAYVIGYASFVTPSGIGFREAALAPMMALYLPAPLAISLSLLARFLSTLGEALAVISVGIPLSRNPRINRSIP